MASYFVVYALCPKDILWVISTFSQTVTVWVPWVPWVPWSKQRVPAKKSHPDGLDGLAKPYVLRPLPFSRHFCWQFKSSDFPVTFLATQMPTSWSCFLPSGYVKQFAIEVMGMPWPIANSDRTERWWFSVAFWIYQRVSMFPQSLQFSIPRRPWVGLLAVVWLSPWLQWNAQQPATPGAAIHQTWWFSMIFP